MDKFPEKVCDFTTGQDEDFFRAVRTLLCDSELIGECDLHAIGLACLMNQAGLITDYQLFREIHEKVIDVLNGWIEGSQAA